MEKYWNRKNNRYRKKYGGRSVEMRAVLDDVMEQLAKKGLSFVAGNVVSNMAMPRRMEIAGCINRILRNKKLPMQ